MGVDLREKLNQLQSDVASPLSGSHLTPHSCHPLAPSTQLSPPTQLAHPILPPHGCHATKNLWKNALLNALRKPMHKTVTRMLCKTTYGKKAAHRPMEKGMEKVKLSIGFSIGE